MKGASSSQLLFTAAAECVSRPIVLLDPDFNLAHVLAPPLPPDEISRDRPRSRDATPPSVGARRVSRPWRGARTRGQPLLAPCRDRPRSPELTRDRPAGCAGNVLEPYLFGKTLDLSPVVILCSLMVWAALWGITGMVHWPPGGSTGR